MLTFFSKNTRWMFPLLSALMLVVVFPPYGLTFMVWFAFVPLFFVIDDQPFKKVFLRSYLCGTVFFLFLVYWLVFVTSVGTIFLILYLGLYFAFFCCSIVYIKKVLKIGFIMSAPLLWGLTEYLRATVMTGFPWDNLGYAFYTDKAICQFVEIVGVRGLSMLALLGNTIVYWAMKRVVIAVKDKKPVWLSVRLPLVVLAVFFVFLIFIRQWGNDRIEYFRTLEEKSIAEHVPLKAALVQANIAQEIKWDSDSKQKILAQYERLTKKAAKSNPDLIVWPESSLPGFFQFDEKETYCIYKLLKELKIPMLFGGNRIALVGDNHYYYNSAYYVMPETGEAQMELAGIYDKIHLVPYGEYIPNKKFLTKIFPGLESVVPFEDFSAGQKIELLTLKDFNFGVSICFEDIFPELIKEIPAQGADFIVNVTNDAWYLRTGAPYQHFYMASFRAIENRVPFVRCSNTGVTGYVNSYGETSLLYGEKSSLIFDEGVLFVDIPKRINSENTFYTQHGEVFLYWASAFSILLLLVSFVYSFGKFLLERLRK